MFIPQIISNQLQLISAVALFFESFTLISVFAVLNLEKNQHQVVVELNPVLNCFCSACAFNPAPMCSVSLVKRKPLIQLGHIKRLLARKYLIDVIYECGLAFEGIVFSVYASEH